MGRSEEDAEACGRCAMSSVAGTMDGDRDPFAGDRIEVAERDLRLVSPGVWLGRVRRRLDDWATRLVHGR
jgi:hypothetical protein